MKYITVRPEDGSFAGWVVVGESMREEIDEASPTLLLYVGYRLESFKMVAAEKGWKMEERGST